MPAPRSRRASLALAAGAAVALAGTTAAIAIGPLGNADRTAEIAAQIDPSQPRNVILLIGDGTDEAILTAARNYELGADGRFALDGLPFVGDVTVHSLKAAPGPDYPIEYVSDSAPTASAWSTGHKTIDGRISQGPSADTRTPGKDLETVLEIYAEQGKRTGNISTAEITDATPAAAGAHINLRGCQGPTDMGDCPAARKANGGKGSISEQLVDNEIDVLMGGGAARYAQATDAGPTVRAYAEAEHGYRTVTDEAGMKAVDSLRGGPVLGLFSESHMTPRYQPLVAVAGGTGGPTTKCQRADRGTQPTLAEMTAKAIALLDNPKGFFLQAESAMIDKQEHAADICGAIGDVRELDDALKVALRFQAKNPDTLIVVTGDHAHSTQIVGGFADGVLTAQVQTADGDPMTVAYSTSPVGADHTGSTVRVAAKGPQAANVTGTIDQTDLFRTLLGRRPSGPPPGTGERAVASIAAQPRIARSALRRRGVRVAVAAVNATRVEIGLFDGDRELASRRLSPHGGSTRLKPSGRVPRGVLQLQVRTEGPESAGVGVRALVVR